jgi:hypothetical protein
MIILFLLIIILLLLLLLLLLLFGVGIMLKYLRRPKSEYTEAVLGL